MSATSPIFSTDRNESVLRYLNPVLMLREMVMQRGLIWQFSIREVQGRYKGSYLGIVWAMINPLLMLVVYTFAFHVVYGAKWNSKDPHENFMVYAMHVFIRIIAFNVFSETLNRAPTLITGNINFVKKVVFPLEILPVSLLGAALFHSVLSVGVMLVGALASASPVHLSLLYLPLCYIPLMLLTLGWAWILASLGVFLRDIGNVVAVVLQLLFFFTPITYSPKAVPAPLQEVMKLHPLALIVNNFGRVVNEGQPPDWTTLAIGTAIGAVTAVIGYAWFMKIKRAFADVI